MYIPDLTGLDKDLIRCAGPQLLSSRINLTTPAEQEIFKVPKI